jgi:hypothetical protein
MTYPVEEFGLALKGSFTVGIPAYRELQPGHGFVLHAARIEPDLMAG